VPILVVGTARPEFYERHPDWGIGRRNALTIGLSPLTDAEITELVGSLLDTVELPKELQSAISSRAGGNPLYADQLTRHLVEVGAIVAEEQAVVLVGRFDAAPIPASSGRTTRHRLDYGGDRQANRALHMIAVCRLRYCQRTQAYAARRKTEGLNRREILRCLKRYIARETYRALRADLANLHTTRPPTPRHVVAIHCGAGPIGIPRHRP